MSAVENPADMGGEDGAEDVGEAGAQGEYAEGQYAEGGHYGEGYAEGEYGDGQYGEAGTSGMAGEGEGQDDEEVMEAPKKRGGHGRRKIEIEYIDDKIRRHITFSKRKAGISKKAYELSRLTGAQVHRAPPANPPPPSPAVPSWVASVGIR